MLATGLRIYRISIVYNKYMATLESQRKALGERRSSLRLSPSGGIVTSDVRTSGTGSHTDSVGNHERKYNESISSANQFQELAFTTE